MRIGLSGDQHLLEFRFVIESGELQPIQFFVDLSPRRLGLPTPSSMGKFLIERGQERFEGAQFVFPSISLA